MNTLDELLAEQRRRQEQKDALSEDENAHPLADIPVTDLPGVLGEAVQSGVQKLSEMAPSDLAIEAVKLPYTAGKAILKGVAQPIIEGIADPRRAIAPVAQTIGAAAGALTGNPLLMIGGSVAGRAIGESIENLIFNKPLLNAESVIETAAAGFGSVIGQVAGGAGRGVLRTKQYLKEGAANTALATGHELETITWKEAAQQWLKGRGVPDEGASLAPTIVARDRQTGLEAPTSVEPITVPRTEIQEVPSAVGESGGVRFKSANTTVLPSDVQVAKQVTDDQYIMAMTAYDVIARRYPGLAKTITKLEIAHDSGYLGAWNPKDRTLSLNPKAFNQDAPIENAIATIMHEITHIGQSARRQAETVSEVQERVGLKARMAQTRDPATYKQAEQEYRQLRLETPAYKRGEAYAEAVKTTGLPEDRIFTELKEVITLEDRLRETRPGGYQVDTDVEGNIISAASPLSIRVADRARLLTDIADQRARTPVYSLPRINGSGQIRTVADTVKYAMDGGMDLQSATEVALQHELNSRKKLFEVKRLVTPDSELEGLGLSENSLQVKKLTNELQRIRKNKQDAKDILDSVGGPATVPVKATLFQRKLRATIDAEHAMTEELARLNNETYSSIPDYLKQDIDTFRKVVETMPEAAKHPFLTGATKYTGTLDGLRPLQAVLRKDGDPQLTHIANTFVGADETHRGISTHFLTQSKAFFKELGPLSDVDKVYIQNLENDPQTYKALLPFVDAVNPQIAVDMIAALRPSAPRLNKAELPNLLKAAKVIQGWQQRVGDPMYAVAVQLAKDAGELPPLRESYITSTYTPRRMLSEFTEQRDRVLRLYDGLAKGDPLTARLGQSLAILDNKIKVATNAAEREALKLRDWRSVILGSDRPIPKELLAAELQGKKSDMGIGLDIEKGSEQYIHNMSKKVVYDRVLESGHTTLKEWKARMVGQGADLDALNGVAGFVQNAILDQTGTRRAIKNQNLIDTVARHSKLGASVARHLDQSLNDFGQLHYLLNIALKPAFYAVNLMQNFLTLMPLVGTESFSHAFAKVIFDKENAIKEAREVGVMQEGLNTLWRDQTETAVQRIGKPLEKGVEATESFNRMVAYFAGKHNAELKGITGYDASKRGIDVAAQSNFLYSAAYRPQLTNTPMTSAMLRYKSFALNYAEFINQLYQKGEYQKLGAAMAAVLATSGTTGIPMYSWVQDRAAELGVVLPSFSPMEQMGFELSGLDSPFPLLPDSIESLAGPLGKIAIDVGQAGQAVVQGGDVGTAVGDVVNDVLGGGIVGRGADALAELSRGGVTRSEGGRTVRSVRTPEQIALSAVGFGPTAGKLNYAARQGLERAVNAKDMGELQRKIVETRAKGVRNQATLIANIRAENTKNKRKSIAGRAFGN